MFNAYTRPRYQVSVGSQAGVRCACIRVQLICAFVFAFLQKAVFSQQGSIVGFSEFVAPKTPLSAGKMSKPKVKTPVVTVTPPAVNKKKKKGRQQVLKKDKTEKHDGISF